MKKPISEFVTRVSGGAINWDLDTLFASVLCQKCIDKIEHCLATEQIPGPDLFCDRCATLLEKVGWKYPDIGGQAS